MGRFDLSSPLELQNHGGRLGATRWTGNPVQWFRESLGLCTRQESDQCAACNQTSGYSRRRSKSRDHSPNGFKYGLLMYTKPVSARRPRVPQLLFVLKFHERFENVCENHRHAWTHNHTWSHVHLNLEFRLEGFWLAYSCSWILKCPEMDNEVPFLLRFWPEQFENRHIQ